MAIVLSVLGVAFAAFCIWLAVRIFNRRERWAKWLAVGTFLGAELYLLSFGPASWLVGHSYLPARPTWWVFRPLTWLATHGPQPIQGPIWWWARSFEPPWDPEINPKSRPPWLIELEYQDEYFGLFGQPEWAPTEAVTADTCSE